LFITIPSVHFSPIITIIFSLIFVKRNNIPLGPELSLVVYFNSQSMRSCGCIEQGNHAEVAEQEIVDPPDLGIAGELGFAALGPMPSTAEPRGDLPSRLDFHFRGIAAQAKAGRFAIRARLGVEAHDVFWIEGPLAEPSTAGDFNDVILEDAAAVAEGVEAWVVFGVNARFALGALKFNDVRHEREGQVLGLLA